MSDSWLSGVATIKEAIFGDGVTEIASNALDGLDSLMCIVVKEGNPVYDSRDNCNAIIETATNALVKGCNGTVIPEGGEVIYYLFCAICLQFQSTVALFFVLILQSLTMGVSVSLQLCCGHRLHSLLFKIVSHVF